jgi:hypothetical protein
MTMSVQRNMVYLNTVASQETAELDRERASDARQGQIKQKMAALDKQEQAGDVRGNAQDTQQVCNSVATGLGAAAAICACFPPVGTIVAAVLAVVAAIVVLVGALANQGKQQEATDLDKQAGLNNVAAEQMEAEVEENTERRKETRASIQANIQQFLQAESEQRQTAREGLASRAQ